MIELRFIVHKRDGLIGLSIEQDNIGTLGVLSAEDALKLSAVLNQVAGDEPDFDGVTLTMLHVSELGEVAARDSGTGKWRFEDQPTQE